MKLLFDQNLSPRLVQRLAGIYPDFAHVMDIGLSAADDRTIWAFAREAEASGRRMRRETKEASMP